MEDFEKVGGFRGRYKMINDRLNKVQVGRDEDVPIKNVWYFYVFDDGSWDASTTMREKEWATTVRRAKHIFAVWHGQWDMNLFLMDKKKLIKRFKKEGYYAFND